MTKATKSILPSPGAYYNVVMSSSTPFSVRLSKDLDRAVADEARRTKRSKGAVLESLVDEGMRVRRFPGVAFRGDDWDRRAWLVGSALDVWEVIQAIQDFGGPAPVVKESGLTPAQVAVATSYYRAHPDEIDALINESRRSVDDVSRLYPTLQVASATRNRRRR
jgi:hypothetical protein